jgi:hypothetical protein
MRSSRKSSFTDSSPSGASCLRDIGLRHVVGLLVIAVMFAVFATPPAAAQGDQCECGPGHGWVQWCTDSTTDAIVNHGALVGIDHPFADGDLNCQLDDNLILTDLCDGDPLIVWRSEARDISEHFPGVGDVDGTNDVIDTEILSMCLTGDSPFGQFTLRAGLRQGLPPSLGAIVQRADNDELAESFFDVFFMVETPFPFGPLYNQNPLRIMANIDCVPPQAGYIKPEGCIPLFDGQGVHRMNLVTARHDVNCPCIPTLPEWGLIIFGLLLLGFITWVFLRRRKTAVSLQ